MALILDFFRRDKVLSGFCKFSLGQCYRAGIFLLGSFNVKLILQRVSSAYVFVNEKEISSIRKGILVLFCAEKGDSKKQVDFFADKTLNLRMFPDVRGKMNFSCQDVGGSILVVSQFTLAGDFSHGRRPGFDRAADPNIARGLYEYFVEVLSQSNLNICKGRFGADMKVHMINDGPVTFLMER